MFNLSLILILILKSFVKMGPGVSLGKKLFQNC